MRFIYTKTFAVFAAFVAVTALFMFLQTQGWLDPIRQMFLQAPRPVAALADATARPIRNFFVTIYDLKGIVSDNQKLSAQVMHLQQQLADLDQEKRENEALRQELGFVSAAKYNLVACTVLGQNAFGLTDSLVLNCGTGRGVAEGQAVISQGRLVGKIVYAGASDSTALLAVSSKFSTDAELSKTGSDGLLEGSFGSGMVLDRLQQNEDVQKDWLVTTAGINPQIPKGILVGQIGEIISGPNDLFKKATVLSPVDFNGLDFVLVVKP